MAEGSLPPFTGAVLTGGRSTRMGRDKAFVEVAGVAMAARVAAALRGAGADEVLAVGGDLAGLEALGFDAVVADLHPGDGPLGGVLTAFAAASQGVVVVLACDLADATAAAVESVVAALGDHDVAMPVTDRREPLHAAWRSDSCAPALGAALERGERALHRAVDGLDVIDVVVPDPGALRNVNRPADLPG